MAEQVNINVVERIPPLSIKLSDQAHAGTVITTEGMPPEVAEEVDWKKIIDAAVELGKRMLGDGGGGGGTKACMEFSAKNPDGSTVTYKWCPAP